MKTLITSIKITVAFCVLFSVGYVLILWGFAQVVAPNSGQAEVVTMNGQVVGAANVGQQFSDSTYFWGRPSAVDYNGSGSGGSNKGPSNSEYLAEVEARIVAFLEAHPYLDRSEVPSELVTASGSGLDPHISPEGAAVQVRRVATARAMTEEQVIRIVEKTTTTPIVGQPFINVLELNVALENEKNN